MRPPRWLEFPRESAQPLRDLWTAAWGNSVVAGLLAVAAGLLAAGGPGAAAAGSGAVLVLLSLAISWGAVRLLPSGGSRALPQALLVAYVVKVLLGAVALILLPLPAAWPRGWFLVGALLCLVTALVTECWVVSRLRIPYFVPPDETVEPRAAQPARGERTE